MSISEQLERMRRERGWTTGDVSAKTGLSEGEILLIEAGVPGVPLEVVEQLSSGLRMTFTIGDTAI
ncbi:helix-turn-helix domain-containing protein [Alkalicoccus chagannorensis]|uniref:helix-turn-helix domain-containing protein n=1 Tax=Alkalicoccus chagannorensis TaxID=427072 RepID=UPI00041F08D2|nr:helix-turn-helix transcriptional regulator [Alkalicoccus chagannorensis]